MTGAGSACLSPLESFPFFHILCLIKFKEEQLIKSNRLK